MYKLIEIYKLIKEEQFGDWEIYCDLDGVLSNFDSRFQQYGNMSPAKYEEKFGKEKFWKVVDDQGEQFWSQMNWMKDGKELWSYIKKYKPTLLSAPSRANSSRVGKHKWVKQHLPNTKLILVDAANKQNYSSFHKLLIDDNSKNIDQWRAKGGTGILHKSANQTISELKDLGL